MKTMTDNQSNSQLVSSIQDTRWIDLGDSHKALREYVESAVNSACVDQNNVAPIMVKGAFGIGKTAILHYLFHYSWTKLKVPAFMLNLSDLIDEINAYITEREIDKLQNKDVSKVLDRICVNQIEILHNSEFQDISSGQIYFPYFKKSNLSKYLEGFQSAKCIKASNGEYLEEMLPLFDANIINEAINTETRALVLIDEFEAKYHELKNIIESSGGGLLRDFLDDVASASSTNFFCIIGNGPSSGYEVSKESSAAEARRIIVKQINAPTVKSLSNSFLRDLPHGHINFYWWLSRSRPGQIKKLKESLQPYEEMVENNYIKFIEENRVFEDPIDDMGESNVSFLKTNILENFDIEVKDVFKRLLINLVPQKLDLSAGLKDHLIDDKHFFYFSKETISIDDVLNALQSDILKIKDGNYRYKSIKYDKIHFYMDLILEALSDSKKQIAFGAPSKSDIEDDLAKTFLSPLFGLLYDFINIYEDETKDSIKTILDLLLDLSNKTENDNILKHFKKTLYLFEDNCIRLDTEEFDTEEIVIAQLSLWAIRNVIEQPIGSPKLSYKSESTDELITNIFEIDKVFSYSKDKNNKIIVIPDIENRSLLKKYIENLESHIQANWESGFNYLNNGQSLLTVIYLSESEEINEFREWFIFKNIEQDIKELPSELKRHNIQRFDEYPIHNSQRISTFLNSLCKIGIIGLHKEDSTFSSVENDEINIEDMISSITNPAWTKSKHQKRTIEYYSDLLQNGENSAFSIVFSDSLDKYNQQIAEYFRKPGELTSFSYDIPLSDREHLEPFGWGLSTKNFVSHILCEYDQGAYGDTCKLLANVQTLNLYSEEIDLAKISLRDIGKALNEVMKEEYSEIHKSYSGNSSNIKSVIRYIEMLTRNEGASSIDDYLDYIDRDNDILLSHFYHLEFSSNKKYFLSGLYYKILFQNVDCQVEQDCVVSEMKDHKNSFSELYAEFEAINQDIASLFHLREDLVNPKDINSYTIQIIAKYLIDSEENDSIIHTVIGQIINQQLSSVIEKINDFQSQIEEIKNSVSPIKEEVGKLQRHIDRIYETGKNTPLIDLLKDRFSRSINKDYLYYHYFLKLLRKSDGGDTYNRIFDKRYMPSRKFDIEDQFIQDLDSTMKQIFEDSLPSIEEVVENALEVNNRYADTERLVGYICEIMNYPNVQSDVTIISRDDEDFPSDGYEKNYLVALQLKENSPGQLVQEIIGDPGQLKSWTSVISNRDKITTMKEFKKYQKQVQNYFASVYERITAPGVLKFTEWVQANDGSKIITGPAIQKVRQALIDGYSDYQEDIDIIAEKINILDSSNSIFEGVKEQIRQVIVLRLSEVDTSAIEEAEVLPDFISDLSDMLAELDTIPEILYTDPIQFAESQLGVDDQNPSVSAKLISSYSGIMKKIVSADDMIFDSDESIQIDMLQSMLQENIEDAKNAVIDVLETDMHNNSDEELNILFEKFEQALNLDPRNASDSLANEIEITWDPIHAAYDIIGRFFNSYDFEKVNLLEQMQLKQGLSVFNEIISSYTTKVKQILSENPISSIKKRKMNEIFRSFTHHESLISQLGEIGLKKEFCDKLTEIADEYIDTKVPILEKLRVDEADIVKIADMLPSLRKHIENVQAEDLLLTGLSDYYEYIIKKIEQINDKYAEILGTSSAHEALPFFNDIPEEGKEVDASVLTEHFDEIKILTQYDLIKITIDKSV
jgi:hypothetical protein